MTLDEMKKIAEERTNGEWSFIDTAHNQFLVCDNKTISALSGLTAKTNDFIFLAMAANNWDKLMAVVEAAETFEYNFEAADAYPTPGVEVTSSCQCCANNQSLMKELRESLKALEEP